MVEKRPERWLGHGRHREFWDWCAKGELRLQRCGGCGAIPWPVVGACEVCASEKLTWEPMSGGGTIAGWCTFERDYYRGMLTIPWDTILAELEEGPLFLSNPKGFGWRDITVGMPVRLAFVDCKDSAGPFSLPVFERA